jgi:hypothetical protein
MKKKTIELAKVTDRLNQIKLNRVLFTTMGVGSNNRSTIPITLNIKKNKEFLYWKNDYTSRISLIKGYNFKVRSFE